ncbi:biotin--[acetyl-CoA-carboxylase] ligase [Desulfococcaceae bacterium HSG9]|nr:biotin--[acetyl-CoA-carboxylase] ligase [Desulfococcaceae bacterium HSG9]
MKERILKILRTEQTVVSGESLSAMLGVSRVSVWKHIAKLREHGYHIVANAKGYRLSEEIDALFPWEFPKRAFQIHFFPETGSTMDIARDLARKGCPDFTVVIAERQTKGRGRLKRVWHSADGGLYFTVVTRPLLPPVHSFRVCFAASVALAETLRTLYKIDAGVKWPNDILVDGRKLSGMLSEMEAEADRVAYIAIGIGINVNNDPCVYEADAVSISQLLGRKVSRKRLLTCFLDLFETKLHSQALDNIVTEWKRRTITLDRAVKIVTVKETLEGVARDIDLTGALVLELDDGTTRNVVYGDCFLKNQ